MSDIKEPSAIIARAALEGTTPASLKPQGETK